MQDFENQAKKLFYGKKLPIENPGNERRIQAFLDNKEKALEDKEKEKERSKLKCDQCGEEIDLFSPTSSMWTHVHKKDDHVPFPVGFYEWT